MFNKKNIIIAIIFLIVVATCYILTHVYFFNGNKIEKVTIDRHTFYAEIVSNSEKLQKGLGNRDSLCQSCAMLFQFANPGKHAFWMKDMRFPLDIVWISDGKVAYLGKNVSEKFPDTMIPPVDANQVLEINAGVADKLDIKVGDGVIFQ